MQTTSATFNAYPDARWSNLRVQFRMIDKTAAGDATARATNYDASISQLTQTHDGTESMSAKWASLETGGWPLDGSCSIMPDDLSGLNTGWWSEVSGADGKFTTDPSLIFEFLSDHSSIGFTILFDDKAGQYPKTMTVTAYDAADTVIDAKTVSVAGIRQVVKMPAENYRKVVFSFSETQAPYQSVRVSEVIFGVIESFDKDNMTGGSLLYELSPTAEYMPMSELVITVDNTDRKYNLVNPDSLYAYLQQGQPLDVQLGVGASRGGLEYVNMGRFYFTNVEAEDDSMTARITANDRFFQLDRSPCRIGTSGTWTVNEAVAAVIADSGLPITAVIPAEIGARTVNKCIPSDASHRDTFRLIAQAAMCTCFFNREDELIFVEIAVGTPVDILDNNNMRIPAKISVSSRINTVKLTVKDEYAGTETVYTASDIGSGETAQAWSVDNPLAYDGADVAAWLLAMAQHRLSYALQERGNPAREIGDTATVYDAYGENRDAVIIREQYIFDGTLSAESKGWG